MLTTKKRGAIPPPVCVALWFVVAMLTGCMPPGPKALLEGERLIREGKFDQAIPRLIFATEKLPQNAQAWNHLGLAYHGSGDLTNARSAYITALRLNRDLFAVRYNLGCLHLDAGAPAQAIDEFRSYLLRTNSLDALIQLGTAQLRSRKLDDADRTFRTILASNPDHPEVLNQLGVLQVMRNRPRDATGFFNSALLSDPGNPAALLNLGVLHLQYFRSNSVALEKFREYLRAEPRPPEWFEVSLLVRKLEGEPAPLPKPAATNPPLQVATAVTNPPLVVPRATANTPSPPRTAPPPTTVRTNPPATTPAAARPVEVAHNRPTPTTRPATEPATRPATRPPATAEPPPSTRPVETPTPPVEPRPAQASNAATPPPVAPETTQPAPRRTPPDRIPSELLLSRYLYRTVPAADPGDRRKAQEALAEGVEAQEQRKLNEAVEAFRRATEADPTYFEAFYNLGYASFLATNIRDALTAYEHALALQPDSATARYNFALALKASSYPQDAAIQLHKLLEKSPADVRVHFSLASLYAVELALPDLAREHYLKVIELQPRHPKAAEIRQWLSTHP